MIFQPTPQDRLQLRDTRPKETPVMYQKWRDLLFLHWEYDADQIQKSLPKGLYVDLFEGRAYLGIVAFTLHDASLKGLPAVPGLSDFPQINFRTYVYDERGMPGIWVYSLDIDQKLTAEAIKYFTGMKYQYAEMKAGREETGELMISASREGTDPKLLTLFRYNYRGGVWEAKPGTLDFFLIERYIAYSTQEAGTKLLSFRIHHHPYPLNSADLIEWDTNLFELDGFMRPEVNPDHVALSKGVDVKFFAPEVLKR